jgi:hypothetical protein
VGRWGVPSDDMPDDDAPSDYSIGTVADWQRLEKLLAHRCWHRWEWVWHISMSVQLAAATGVLIWLALRV